MLSFMNAAHNASTRRDTTTPLARYRRATGPDGWLTADGWLRLASDMHDCGIERAMVGMPGPAAQYFDRAADCRSRAARICRGAL